MTKEKTTGLRIPPISVRVSANERASLERSAGSRSLSTYVRAKLFEGQRKGVAPSGITADEYKADVARLLAKLGASGLASSLSDLALAAKVGTLPVSGEVAAMLKNACSEIKTMRQELMRALGLRKTGTDHDYQGE